MVPDHARVVGTVSCSNRQRPEDHGAVCRCDRRLVAEVGPLCQERHQAGLEARPRKRAVGAGVKHRLAPSTGSPPTLIHLRHGATYKVPARWLGVDRSTKPVTPAWSISSPPASTCRYSPMPAIRASAPRPAARSSHCHAKTRQTPRAPPMPHGTPRSGPVRPLISPDPGRTRHRPPQDRRALSRHHSRRETLSTPSEQSPTSSPTSRRLAPPPPYPPEHDQPVHPLLHTPSEQPCTRSPARSQPPALARQGRLRASRVSRYKA